MSVMSDALETAINEMITEAIQVKLDEFDLTDLVSDAVEEAAQNLNFEDAVQEAVGNFDFSDAVSDACKEYDFSDEVQGEVEEAISEADIAQKVQDTVDDIDFEEMAEEALDSAKQNINVADIIKDNVVQYLEDNWVSDEIDGRITECLNTRINSEEFKETIKQYIISINLEEFKNLIKSQVADCLISNPKLEGVQDQLTLMKENHNAKIRQMSVDIKSTDARIKWLEIKLAQENKSYWQRFWDWVKV
jgi:hypothetical protein